MSTFVNQIFIFLVITILPSRPHARESQFFGKIPSTAAKDVVTFPEHPDWLPETGNIPSTAANDVVSFPKQPDWLPETGNRHGLYGQASGDLRTSDVSAAEFKPQPEKYNPESYEPEFVGESADFGSNPNNFKSGSSLYDGPQNYRLTPEEEQAEYRNSHYKGGGGDLALISAGLNNRRGESVKNGFHGRNNYYGNGGNGYGFNGGKNSEGGYEKLDEYVNGENIDFQP